MVKPFETMSFREFTSDLLAFGSSLNFEKEIRRPTKFCQDSQIYYKDSFLPSPVTGVKTPPIGKLSTKEEAAGKVRVFAMVDIWTQILLSPLHN